MSRALFIVDIQNDFTEGGALAVTGGDAVAEAVSVYLETHAGDYGLIIASRDWHDPDSDNGGHFAAEPDYVDTWPVHCVAGTDGAAYDPGLRTDAITHHIKKGQGEPAYSLLEGVTDDGRSAADLLTEHGTLDVDVVGIATDHCVRASALDAVALGRRVRVLTDLVAGVSEETTAAALAELGHAGVELVSSAGDEDPR